MVTLADARRIIAAAEKKAAQMGQPMNIAVVDQDGNLISHVRMDGAWLGSKGRANARRAGVADRQWGMKPTLSGGHDLEEQQLWHDRETRGPT
jgi:hypothetical protein